MAFDLVQLLFHVAGELQVHHLGEVLHQQIGHRHADLGGIEAPLLLLDVAALLDLADDGGVGARPADAFFFQRFHQRGFVVAGRRLREMLRRQQLQKVQLLLVLQRRQQGILLLAARRQDAAIAVELQHLALGLEEAFRGPNLDVGNRENRRRHLAGHKPVVDQRVEPELIGRQQILDALRCVGQIGRADRFVRFLGTLAGGVPVRLCR